MMSVVVSMVMSSLYVNYIASVFTIQQTFTYVCRRTNNYFVALFVCEDVVFFTTGIGIYSSCKKITTVDGVFLGQEDKQQ
jgi:hypothetical protein